MNDIKDKLFNFVQNECIPAEPRYHEFVSLNRWNGQPPVMEKLKKRARELGLWNLFIPREFGGLYSISEYAQLCEIMGHSPQIAPEACNSSAPDTGNMEVLMKFGTLEQKKAWLEPLLEGKIRSAFAMTEPLVASSDATNIQTKITKSSTNYTLNGRKWWITVPANTPGIKRIRALTVFGHDDANVGHWEIEFVNVKVPLSNIIGHEGMGFQIGQSRLGPGRLHHCMRAIGMAERSLQTAFNRIKGIEPKLEQPRKVFGKEMINHEGVRLNFAESRVDIELCRSLVMRAAIILDEHSSDLSKEELSRERMIISVVKAVVPKKICNIIDRCIQLCGAGGLSSDFHLSSFYGAARSLRLADGPDEVHYMSIGKMEINKLANL